MHAGEQVPGLSLRSCMTAEIARTKHIKVKKTLLRKLSRLWLKEYQQLHSQLPAKHRTGSAHIIDFNNLMEPAAHDLAVHNCCIPHSCLPAAAISNVWD